MLRSLTCLISIFITSNVLAQPKGNATPAESMTAGMMQMMDGMQKSMEKMAQTVDPTAAPATPSGPTFTESFSFDYAPQYRFGVQALFGIPNGLRGQLIVGGKSHDTAYILEVFTGGQDRFWGEDWVLGGMGRIQATISEREKGQWLLSPGFGVSYWKGEKKPPTQYYYDWYTGQPSVAYQPNYRRDQWYLNLDVNLSYLRPITSGLAWELGMFFGTRIGISGEEADGDNISGKIKGTIGGFTGFRF